MMINVQYWLAYHAHYGEESLLGRALLEAQSDQIVVEGCGVPISDDMLKRIKLETGNIAYPALLTNTSEDMYKEAVFVMNSKACT